MTLKRLRNKRILLNRLYYRIFLAKSVIMKKSRREFLQKAGIATAATALMPQMMWSQSTLAKQKLGIALVGLGYYSTDLLAPA